MSQRTRSSDLRVLPGGRSRPPSDPFLDETLALLDGDPNSGSRADEVRLSALGQKAVGRALAREVLRRRLLRGAVATTSLAAAVFLGIFVSGLAATGAGHLVSAHGQVSISSPSDKAYVPWTSERALSSGDALRTEEGEARVLLEDGADLAIGGHTSVELPQVSAGSVVLRVARGTVTFAVPPLANNASFVVEAGDARLVVHGTEFSVTMLEEAASPCVVVRRGVVEQVSPGKRLWLRAGDESGCVMPVEDEHVPAALETPEQQRAPQPVPPRSSGPQKSTRSEPSKTASSDLAQQNRHFQTALSEQRAGHLSQAEKAWQQFLKSYPDSPLAPQARMELSRVQASRRASQSAGR